MNELDQEKHNIVVRQCCALIDEKRERDHQLSIAFAEMKLILHVCEEMKSFGDPLDVIKRACHRFIDLPDLP